MRTRFSNSALIASRSSLVTNARICAVPADKGRRAAVAAALGPRPGGPYRHCGSERAAARGVNGSAGGSASLQPAPSPPGYQGNRSVVMRRQLLKGQNINFAFKRF